MSKSLNNIFVRCSWKDEIWNINIEYNVGSDELPGAFLGKQHPGFSVADPVVNGIIYQVLGEVADSVKVLESIPGKGETTILSGHQEIVIETGFTPNSVNLEITSVDPQIEGGNDNTVNYTVSATGFTIIADIQSISCLVSWTAYR